MGDPRMIIRREEEAEAGSVEDLARFHCGQVEPRAERCQDIGRAAFGGKGPVSVLDHREAAPCSDQRRGCRDVDRPGIISTGAAAVGEEIFGRGKGPGGRLQRDRRANQLFGRLAAHAQGDESRRHQRLGEAAVDDGLEQRAGILAAQIVAVEEARHRQLGGSILGNRRGRHEQLALRGE